MKILDILSDKLELSPKEETTFDIWLNSLERDALTLAKQSTSTGGVAGVDTGNVVISLEDGVTLYNPDTGARTIYLDPDGDAWFGKDIDDPDTTTMFIVSNDQTYNSEDVGEGDLLIGSNSADEGNMYWDDSAKKLYFRSGTTVSVEIGDGGIIASWGLIGGWTINADNISSPNDDIILDSTNDTIQLGSGGGTYIIIDGANLNIRSGNYSADAIGWQIDNYGNAEFNNVKARGKFTTAVFEKDTISAVGGHVWISKNAGMLESSFLTGTAPDPSVSISIWDSVAGDQLAEAGDILVMREWSGSALVICYLTVNSAGASVDGRTVFNVDYESGDDDSDFMPGTAIVNIGPANAGIIELKAGETTTRISLYEHDAEPWNGLTTKLLLGNMRDTYGTGANDRYGIGIGDYSGKNYLSYNAEAADAFIIRGGAGAVRLDANGLVLLGSSSLQAPEAVRFYYDDGGAWDDEQGGRMYFGFDGTPGGDAVLWLEAMWDGAAGDNPWGKISLWLSAWDTATSNSVDLILNEDTGVITMSGASLNTVHVSDADLKVTGGGIYTGSGDITPGTGAIHTGAGIAIYGSVSSAATSTGALELEWDGTRGDLMSYHRAAGTYEPMRFRASDFSFSEGSTVIAKFDVNDLRVAQGIALGKGDLGGDPADGQIRWYWGNTFVGDIVTYDAWFRFNQNTSYNIYSPRYFYGAQGLRAGSAAPAPTSGDVTFSDRIRKDHGGTDYSGNIYVPVTPDVRGTSWWGTAKSTGGTTITVSTTFPGIPSDVRAIAIRVMCRDSAIHPRTSEYFIIGPDSTSNDNIGTRAHGNNMINENSGICNVTSNTIYAYRVASGAGTLDCWLAVTGYFI